MTSLEIAELTGKQHKNLMRDIRNMEPAWVKIAVLNGTIEFCVSTEILLEYEEILAAIVSPYMADIVIQALINRPNLIRVEPTWRWHLIEADQDDNKFVDCAITGQAEYIVSNDSHFRVLRQIPFPYVPLMTLSEFTQDLNATHNS